MTNEEAIRVEQLTKIYRLYENNLDRVKEAVNLSGKRYSKDFYALKDVSFNLKKGETLGIIGKNGAGKSTLLKLITGVLTPSSGAIETHGKIASLLELGAGFNPDMTGIENIYLNGTIMGYTKAQMDARLQDIINFADIGEFIKQPVKMYSSGMFARLAFAVNINVEPEILIIDEALSVGDIAFQYKCFQKMAELKAKGIALIFVSHSTQQILMNCDRAILLDEGRLLEDSKNVISVINSYEKLLRGITNNKAICVSEDANSSTDDSWLRDYVIEPQKDISEHRMGTHRAIIRNVFINDSINNDVCDTLLYSGEKVYCHFKIYSKFDLDNVVLGVSIKNKEGVDLWVENNLHSDCVIHLHRGVNLIVYSFDINLVGNQYLLCAGLVRLLADTKEDLDHRWPIKPIEVITKTDCAGGIVYSPINVIADNQK